MKIASGFFSFASAACLIWPALGNIIHIFHLLWKLKVLQPHSYFLLLSSLYASQGHSLLVKPPHHPLGSSYLTLTDSSSIRSQHASNLKNWKARGRLPQLMPALCIRSSSRGTFPLSPFPLLKCPALPLLLHPNPIPSTWCTKLGPVSASLSLAHNLPEADMSLNKYWLPHLIPLQRQEAHTWVFLFNR